MAEVIIIKNREKQFALVKDFHDYLERKKNEPSTHCYYGQQRNCQPDVDFYEWSNIMGEPRRFRFLRELIPFLDDSGIVYTEEQIDSLKSSYTKRYAACLEGTNELQLAYSLDTLKNYVKKDVDQLDYNCKTKVDERKAREVETKKNLPSCVPCTTSGHPMYQGSMPMSEYMDGEEYGWWD